MPAAQYNIVIEQGATFSLLLSLKKPNKLPVDLTGYSAKCQIRKTIPSSEEDNIIAEPVCEILSPTTSGVISVTLDKETTEALDFNSAEYDIFVKSSTGETSKLMKGNVTFDRSVTIWEE